MWQMTIQMKGNHDLAGEMLMAAVDGESISVLRAEGTEGAENQDWWDMQILTPQKPDMTRLTTALDALADIGIDAGAPMIEPLADIDWLAKNWRDLRPLSVGRFWLYGSHISEAVPAGKIGIRLDAGQAFGSGHHATTRGCILALEKYVPESAAYRLADVGAGSGILAIAAAKINPNGTIIAVDNDPIAVAVMEQNCRDNDVAVSCGVSDGYRGAMMRGGFDIVVANILPKPLIAMAAEAAASLVAGGRLILSGLNLDHDDSGGAAVAAAHHDAGLTLIECLAIEDWLTLIFEKGDAK